jgi:hypothetical protein
MNQSTKNYFKFSFFEELKEGDVFKFSPVMDNDIPSKFYTVYKKTDTITKINATYGKVLNRMEFNNNLPREVMIFVNR